jgi:hypothetical protein
MSASPASPDSDMAQTVESRCAAVRLWFAAETGSRLRDRSFIRAAARQQSKIAGQLASATIVSAIAQTPHPTSPAEDRRHRLHCVQMSECTLGLGPGLSRSGVAKQVQGLCSPRVAMDHPCSPQPRGLLAEGSVAEGSFERLYKKHKYDHLMPTLNSYSASRSPVRQVFSYCERLFNSRAPSPPVMSARGLRTNCLYLPRLARCHCR